MKVLDIYGRERNVNLKKYLIDWDEDSCSKFQTSIKTFLKPYWKTHVVTEEFRIPSSKLRCDIINWSKKIVIEGQSSIHGKFVEHFHGSRAGYLNSWRRDLEKEKWINKIGFTFVEIYEEDIKNLSRKFFIDKIGIDLI